jgi:hypothetical protein
LTTLPRSYRSGFAGDGPIQVSVGTLSASNNARIIVPLVNTSAVASFTFVAVIL